MRCRQILIKGILIALRPPGSGTSKVPCFTPKWLQLPGNQGWSIHREMKGIIRESQKPEAFGYLCQHQKGLALPSRSLGTALPSPTSARGLGCRMAAAD